MVYKIADNIWSPLGTTTKANYQAVKSEHTALSSAPSRWGTTEPSTAAVFSDAQNEELMIPSLTRFESLVVRSVQQALQDVALDVSNEEVVFVLSTTKANVGLQGEADTPPEILYPGESARRISTFLGITTTPIVVCNACISGLSAVILASRLIESGQYRHAIVCGADVLNRFILSGFQSLKALSETPCRPFDMERLGMNLGEAAATMILSAEPWGKEKTWVIGAGAIRNDAYHISTPSNKAEGATKALQAILKDADISQLAVVNAHGTGTMFMDQMESVAIAKTGLTDIPVNSYKGYYGHTLGAAGVLETVLTMQALDDHTIIGTRGFEELGVSGQLKLSPEHQTTDKTAFVKIISGFGGGNAGMELGLQGNHNCPLSTVHSPLSTLHHVRITPDSVTIDGKPLTCEGHGKELLTALYKQYVGDYPKFYKMDMLCRLGFIASELLEKSDADTAVVLFNHSSSIHADRAYLETISEGEDYFPSPSLFVYTLPNIVAGEIAIRHQYHGESSFYILPEHDELLMRQIQAATFADPAIDNMITGWLDYEDDDHFLADLYLLSKPLQ
jgi:3-oxoacyl-[acyl-carrier-protein] synthase-1